MLKFSSLILLILISFSSWAQEVDIESIKAKLDDQQNQEAIDMATEQFNVAQSDDDKSNLLYWRALGFYNLASSINTQINPDKFPEVVESLMNAKDDLLMARDLADEDNVGKIDETLEDLSIVFYNSAAPVVQHLWQTGDIESVGNDYEAAYAYLNAAIEIKPDYRAYDKLGNLDEISGKYDEAYENYRKAFEHFTNKDPEQIDYGIAILGMKIAEFEAYYFDTNPEEEDYIGDVQKALKTIEETEALLLSESIRAAMSPDFKDASDFYTEQFVEYQNKLISWKINLWNAAWQTDFPGMGEIKSQLNKTPEDYLLLVMYGDLLLNDGQTMLAIEQYEKATELNPLISSAWQKLGLSHSQMPLLFNYSAEDEMLVYARALEAYEEAYQLEPDNLELLSYLIDLSILAGDDIKLKKYQAIADQYQTGN